MASSKLSGDALREAARNNNLGEEKFCYKPSENSQTTHSDDSFADNLEHYLNCIRAIVGKKEEEGSFNQVASETHGKFVKVNLQSSYQTEGDGFDDEQEETKTKIHSLVERASGNIYLVKSPGDHSPALEYGVRSNIFDDDHGELALNSVSGSLRPFIATVMEIVSLGVDVDSVNAWGETALMQAAVKGHIEVCAWLLEHGKANPNIAADSGATALMKAVERGPAQIEICQLLIQHGADVNIANHWGNTALHVAAFRGYDTICELLVSSGAQKALENHDKHTAYYYSKKENCEVNEIGEPCYKENLEQILAP